MRFFIAAALPVLASSFSFSAYDLGFLGLYPTQKYESMSLEPPSVQITKWDERCIDDGSVILISPRGVYVPKPGPVILDTRGNLVWMEESFGQAMNLQVQKYKGQDFITFWSGTSHGPHSNGSYYMIDSSYEIIHTVTAVGLDLYGDLHEFHITEQGTALITIYNDIELDCTAVGVPGKCWIDDCLFQEIDIETGTLIFQWRASDHIPLTDSYKTRGGDGDGSTPELAYDFFHMNSIEKDGVGNYIISSRHMHAIYCISPSGDILWTLGGRHSDFTDLSNGQASNFAWQHHARLHENNTMSLYDNGGNNVFQKFSHSSRGMIISLDTTAMTVSLLHTYEHPSHLLAISQGSMQIVPGTPGNVLVGWGNTPAFTEFTIDGEVLCDMHFGPSLVFELLDFGWVKSYRAFKSTWIGLPKTPPDAVFQAGKVFVSWNGATEVDAWVLQGAELASAGEDDFIEFDHVAKVSFETVFELEEDMSGAFVRVLALDKEGRVLGRTLVINTTLPPAKMPLIAILAFFCSVIGAGSLVWRYRSFLSKQCTKIFDILWRRESQQQYELLGGQESNDERLCARDMDMDRGPEIV